ncbi:MAG: hypothetical protein O2887_03390 [Bacteroidetes bacterium]|nr:hypothetical protein [Bacteroidota bacterium]MDA1119529.1 hypothetical protein [Bacteroidota bacterium]
MKNVELTKEEHLALISEMIVQAKQNVAKGGSFYFLLWGWVIMLANLGHYLIDKLDLYPYPFVVWFLTIPALIATIIYGIRQDRNARVVSHYDRIYGHLWTGIFVLIITVLAFMSKLSFNHNAVILLLSGLGTYISGTMLRFKPLIFGGIWLWAVAVVAFSVSVQDQYLIAGIGLFIGYLIPGYLLKRIENE